MAATEQISEEEILMEVEAVESVYGDDCTILNRFPPLLHLHIKPRTADVHSQQFVEATIEVRAGPQYPSDPPYVGILGSKGLDENRLKHLSSTLHQKARELASCLMLVALCEEAVEILTRLNHPEGDCPLCLYPLVSEVDDKSLPFMKLMSCFHCFHCECIVRWLKWIQIQNEGNYKDEENQHATDLREMMGDNAGNCPVCRKVFLAKDIDHILDSVGSHGVDSVDVDEKELREELLKCELENSRRQKFEVTLELQQQRGGLIEPPKDNVLFSRISIDDLISEVSPVNGNGEVLEHNGDRLVSEEAETSGSSDQTHATLTQWQFRHNGSMEPGSSGSRGRFHPGQRRHSGTRKHGRNNSKIQSKQWVKKE